MDGSSDGSPILFDCYTWNNAWGYQYMGHLITRDGQVKLYTLPHEASFDPSLITKIKEGHNVRQISPQLLSIINNLFDTLPGVSCPETEMWSRDAGHTSYIGYKEGKEVIFYRAGDNQCAYELEMHRKTAARLVQLIDLCISDAPRCAYCDRREPTLLDEDLLLLFCNETCRQGYELRMPRVDKPDIKVMMMRPENGRTRK